MQCLIIWASFKNKICLYIWALYLHVCPHARRGHQILRLSTGSYIIAILWFLWPCRRGLLRYLAAIQLASGAATNLTWVTWTQEVTPSTSMEIGVVNNTRNGPFHFASKLSAWFLLTYTQSPTWYSCGNSGVQLLASSGHPRVPRFPACFFFFLWCEQSSLLVYSPVNVGCGLLST